MQLYPIGWYADMIYAYIKFLRDVFQDKFSVFN